LGATSGKTPAFDFPLGSGGGSVVDAFTGQAIDLQGSMRGDGLAVGEILDPLPVALLVGEAPPRAAMGDGRRPLRRVKRHDAGSRSRSKTSSQAR